KFVQSCNEYKAWLAAADESILPFGTRTTPAYLSYQQVKEKVDDYFIRTRMAAYDSASANALNVLVAQVEAISPKNLSSNLHEISSYPLSKIEASKPLNLVDGLNPAWQVLINNFKQQVSDVMFNKTNV